MENNIRSEVDFRNEKIGYKIREAEMMKIPFMFIIGQKEVEADSVSVRRHQEGDLGSSNLANIIIQIQKEVAKKE